ncbi:hypothetical protein, partial [Vibrio vulnificus]|uniref:hypothetical protein n=1 Tax=Vibrio vulnificus TaxID=672 RepID=UPI0019D4E4AF
GGITSDRTILPIFNYGTPFLLVAALSVFCGLWTFWTYRDASPPKGKTHVDILLPMRITHEAGRHHRVAFLSIVFFL